MRKIVLAVVLLAVPAFGQSVDKPTRIAVFVSNPGLGVGEDSSGDNTGFGVALEHRFTRAWSAELAVATEHHTTRPFLFGEDYRLHTYPIDVLGRYTFQSIHTKWRPYIGAGLRYVGAPEEPPNVHYDNRLSPEIAGGVDFNPVGSWSLRFDIKQLVSTAPVYDEMFKVSLGVGWRF